MDRFTKEYLNIINEDNVIDSNIAEQFEYDVAKFVQHVREGYGYILRSDIINQFNRYTNNRWASDIFNSEFIELHIVDKCNSEDIEVFETEEEMFDAHPNDF